MRTESLGRADRTAQILRDFFEQPFISHEREELVEKLLQSEDPGLKEAGLREKENIKQRVPAFKAIKRW